VKHTRPWLLPGLVHSRSSVILRIQLSDYHIVLQNRVPLKGHGLHCQLSMEHVSGDGIFKAMRPRVNTVITQLKHFASLHFLVNVAENEGFIGRHWEVFGYLK